MKKIIKLFSLLFVMLFLIITGCTKTSEDQYKIIVPNGTPLLGMAEFLLETDNYDKEIVAGGDALVAAFTKGEHDIIVAPVNVGAKMYNQNGNYLLYKTFVWGNFYIASTKEINDFKSLEGQNIVVFGKNSSPDIMLKVIMQYYNISLNITYVDDVATANSYLLGGKNDLILSAEPSLTVLKNKKTIYTLNLQEEWKKATEGNSFPQAAVFVKKETLTNKNFIKSLETLNDYLDRLVMPENYEAISLAGTQIHTSFETMGQNILLNSIPYCNYQVLSADLEKNAVNKYLEKLIELSLAPQVGGKLPNDEFYYNN